jgi:hypothetical protein
MPAPFPRVVQATVVSKLHDQECNNVLHFGTSDLEAILLQLGVAIVTCLVSTFRPMTSDEWVFEKVVLRELHPELSDPVEYIHNVTVQGTGLPTSPSFCANLMQIKTGKGGRSNRGRTYWPGVIENDVTKSRLTDGGMDKFVAFCNCLRDAFIKQGELAEPTWNLGVLSRKKASTPPNTVSSAFVPATALVPQRIVARMGSRKVGVGS